MASKYGIFFIATAVAKVLDPDLEVWLKGCGLDKPTIDKVVIASKIHNEAIFLMHKKCSLHWRK